MAVNLHTLVARLNPACKTAMEAAAGLCLARGHYDVDIEHLFIKLLEIPNGDLTRILRQFDIPAQRLDQSLQQALDTFKRGNTRTPALSVQLPQLLEAGWMMASIEFAEARIRSGHLLLALLGDDALKRLAAPWLQALSPINGETLRQEFRAIVAPSAESQEARGLADADAASASMASDARGAPSATPNLDRYCINLTRRAQAGELDPVLGRDDEIRLMIDILTRRRQNNPILTGEPGVGKTAVVEGLAMRIVQGDVPPALAGVTVQALDLGMLQAGASVKGEFENRLKGVIDEVKRSPTPIIVFIDEAHTLIGAGGQAGQNDAANLLKPALARGEMRTIAATTWSEYKKYFEKDAALTRRFQVVKVDEPHEARAITMLRGVAQTMAAHHGVRILNEALVEAVRLSARYIPARQLPDKAVSVLDTACARIAISRHATPAALEAALRRLDDLHAERGQLQREAASGADHAARLADIDTAIADTETERDALNARWQQERDTVDAIHAALAQIDAHAATAAAPAPDAGQIDQLNALRSTLRDQQGDTPMVHAVVDGNAVADVIAGWTGIPVGRMVADEIDAVLKLDALLSERVIGQSHALRAIAQRIRTSRANLEDPGKPKGVFLLVGTSGVGKTETAIALADSLYGGERNMIVINMSEYQEAHTVSSLKGSPPGYVGYGEGGVLTEAVRRRPYSVVLLDEIEKAHPDVLELFFQVFDKGLMEDGEGREIDFRNTLILLTSNAATATIMQACRTASALPTVQELDTLIRPELNDVFKPAFLGRCTVIPYYPLNDADLRRIVEIKLDRIRKRVAANHQAAFEWTPALADAIAARCTEVDSGARNIDHILTGTLLPQIAQDVLMRMNDGQAIAAVHADIAPDGNFVTTVT